MFEINVSYLLYITAEDEDQASQAAEAYIANNPAESDNWSAEPLDFKDMAAYEGLDFKAEDILNDGNKADTIEEDDDTRELREWTKQRFRSDTFIGAIARDNHSLTQSEYDVMNAAREGWYARELSSHLD